MRRVERQSRLGLRSVSTIVALVFLTSGAVAGAGLQPASTPSASGLFIEVETRWCGTNYYTGNGIVKIWKCSDGWVCDIKGMRCIKGEDLVRQEAEEAAERRRQQEAEQKRELERQAAQQAQDKRALRRDERRRTESGGSRCSDISGLGGKPMECPAQPRFAKPSAINPNQSAPARAAIRQSTVPPAPDPASQELRLITSILDGFRNSLNGQLPPTGEPPPNLVPQTQPKAPASSMTDRQKRALAMADDALQEAERIRNMGAMKTCAEAIALSKKYDAAVALYGEAGQPAPLAVRGRREFAIRARAHFDEAIEKAQRQGACGGSRPRTAAAGNRHGGASPSAAGDARFEEASRFLKDAQKKCAALQANESHHKACVLTELANSVRKVHPEIDKACTAKTRDAAARNECVLKAYGAALGPQTARGNDDPNCYFYANGQPCYPATGGPAKANPNNVGRSSLRDELRKRLDRMPNSAHERTDEPAGATGTSGKADSDQSQPAEPGQVPQASGNQDSKPHSSGAYDSEYWSRRLPGNGVNVGVPNSGSFANDVGGDKLLGETVPSRR